MTQAGSDVQTLESRTRAIGRELFALVRRHGPAEPWWERWAMRQTMRDEAIKAQLFRFVDVLPALRTTPQVNDHVREYLESVADRLPRPLGAAVSWVPHDGWLGKQFAGITRANAQRMALRFIAAS